MDHWIPCITLLLWFQQQKLCLWHTQQKNVRTLWPPYLTSLYWCQREWQANAQQGLEKRSKQERNCNQKKQLVTARWRGPDLSATSILVMGSVMGHFKEREWQANSQHSLDKSNKNKNETTTKKQLVTAKWRGPSIVNPIMLIKKIPQSVCEVV